MFTNSAFPSLAQKMKKEEERGGGGGGGGGGGEGREKKGKESRTGGYIPAPARSRRCTFSVLEEMMKIKDTRENIDKHDPFFK